MKPDEKKYWLIKSEPGSYSIDDLERDKTTSWDGVRNYQARNFIKSMTRGDLALFYHSGNPLPGVAGIAEVINEARPDVTALERKDTHYDPKATSENPIWWQTTFKFVSKFKNLISLTEIKFRPDLKGIVVAQRGSRLSVQPVSPTHFEIIKKLGMH